MGSGPSKQPSSAKTVSQKGSVENKKSSDPPLLGSSQPPKGPWAVKGSQQTGKGQADQRKGNNEAEKNRSGTIAGNEERKGSREAQDAIVSRPVTSSKRVKSARAGPNKTMVRQMERGIPNEDTEEIDTIIGLGRERTRLQIKREKTRVRDVFEEAKRKKTLSRFQSATKQLRAMKTFEHPMSKEEEVFMGNIGIECPSTAKVVRIFTSSTFTDTKHERNTLMKEAYPRLKTFCQELGYEFQVVDMRWGVRDQATDDHMGTEICMKELKMCQKLSTGPNFVSLMSHKYGYTDFPRCIEATEFESMMKNVEDKDVRNLFHKWYQKDLNSIPESYVVSSISTKIPDFISTDQEKKKVAKSQWWSESEKMQATLETVASKVFDAEKARKYIRSVTETEVMGGMLMNKNPGKHCLWLKRNIKDIDKQESNFLLSRYIECTHNNSEEKVKKTRELQKDLTENQMCHRLPPTQILSYDVTWNKETGIDPKVEEHNRYLKKLANDFVDIMSSMINKAVKEKAKSEDLLVNEIYQHISFCQNKCQDFYGREHTLKIAKDYIMGTSGEPLVLHGESGSGKTSVMAMIAKEAWSWTKYKPAIIIRFIGTTPGSSSINSLLSSITQQIRKAYNMNWAVSEDLTVLVDEFQLSLFLATTSRPMILILDSLDQLDPSQNARQLQWLPTKLRPNVKIIVSTLPDARYECLPVLKTMVKTEANFLSIPRLPQDDVKGILQKWLTLKHRKLTDDQKKIVFTAFTKCPIPLFLKLSFDTASSWTSFAPKSTTVLEATVRDSINSLLQRLETMHGHVFVSRALGYLTTAKNGLTEAELEDIMSCDDDVLNDVYMYWEPPVRRLPPLLFVRLKADLSQYLADRGADGVQVIYWYHRQFVEAAEARYCQGETSQKLHTALADYFGGTWANGKKKPYTTNKGDKGEADRHVSSQPIKFGNSYNLRKLNNLPYHRTKARQVDLLKKNCLCNIDFLLSKLKATSLWKIMDDFMLARKIFPEDEMIGKITDVLQLSQHGLLYDGNQLTPQILGRLARTKNTEKFLEECLKYPVPCLIPNKLILTQPGGQLLHSMAGHRAEILSLDFSTDSKTILTSGDDGTIRLWSVKNGKQARMFDGLGKVSKAYFCMKDEYILVLTDKKLTVRSLKSGEKVFDIDSASDSNSVCLAGENKSLLIVFHSHKAVLTDLNEGKTIATIEIDDNFEFGFPGIACGCKNYAAVTTSDQEYFTVVDLKKQEFRSMCRGFEPFYDEEVGETIQKKYEIDEIIFSTDEKQVIYSNIYTNDIVFFDHKSESKVKVIKGNPNDYIRSLKCSKDGKSLFLVNSTYVNFYDIKSGNKTEELEHPVDVVSVCSNDMKTVITAAEDSSVRVWDRTRKTQKISQSPGIAANRIRTVCLHENSRYLIGFGFKTRENDSQFIFVYDLMLDKVVRERKLDCSILKMELLSQSELLILPDVERKLQIVDINTLKVVKDFQGCVPKRSAIFRLVPERNEVITLSRGKQNVKIYNVKTGKVAAILETKQKQKLEGICVDKSGTTLIAFSEEDGPIHAFSIASRQKLCTLNPEHTVFTEDELALTPDGRYMLYTVESIPPGGSKGEEIHIEVCDTKTGSKKMSLVDIEFYKKYHSEKIKTGLSSAVDSFQVLDNKTVLSTHDDFIVRIFDLSNGSVLHRLKGHLTGVETIYNPSSQFLLTYGSWTEENSLRLWDKNTYECIASYTLDRMVYNVNFSSDGKFVLACTGKPAEIVLWKFFNFKQDQTVHEQDYPVLFKGEDLEGYLDLVNDDTEKTVDPSDPDKDIESESSDDSDEE